MKQISLTLLKLLIVIAVTYFVGSSTYKMALPVYSWLYSVVDFPACDSDICESDDAKAQTEMKGIIKGKHERLEFIIYFFAFLLSGFVLDILKGIFGNLKNNKTMNITPENITELKPNEIFVFGSNWAGRHGKGAALQAVKWGAKYGVGLGLEGQTFALPTKNRKLETCELHEINSAIIQLHICVMENKNKHFLITKIGCGLALCKEENIAPLFKIFTNCDNVSLPKDFIEILNLKPTP